MILSEGLSFATSDIQQLAPKPHIVRTEIYVPNIIYKKVSFPLPYSCTIPYTNSISRDIEVCHSFSFYCCARPNNCPEYITIHTPYLQDQTNHASTIETYIYATPAIAAPPNFQPYSLVIDPNTGSGGNNGAMPEPEPIIG